MPRGRLCSKDRLRTPSRDHCVSKPFRIPATEFQNLPRFLKRKEQNFGMCDSVACCRGSDSVACCRGPSRRPRTVDRSVSRGCSSKKTTQTKKTAVLVGRLGWPCGLVVWTSGVYRRSWWRYAHRIQSCCSSRNGRFVREDDVGCSPNCNLDPEYPS